MNLSFLNNFFLYFLPLTLIPFILHLLFRKKPVKIQFSHLHFLRVASKHAIPKSRLQHWLLLIIRALIILLLILLFSRPILHVGGAGESGEENAFALVVIVDASYSMQSEVNGRSIYDRAVDTAQAIIETLRPIDRAAVLVYSDRLENPSPALIGDTDNLRQILSKTSPTYRTTEIIAGIAKAFELLSESPAVNKGIVTLTDRASHGWPEMNEDLSDKILHFDDNVHLLFVDCGLFTDNLYIKKIDILPDLWGQKSTITWQVYNPVNKRFFKKDISVLINDKKISSRGIMINPLQSSSGVMPFSIAKGGILPGRIVLSPDALLEDNQFYFYIAAQKKISVLCVDGDPVMGTIRGETYYLRLALSRYQAQSGIELKVINQDELEDTDISQFHVLLLCNVHPLSKRSANKLIGFAQSGGGLGIFPGDKITAESYTLLKDYLPVQFGRKVDSKDTKITVQKGQDLQASLFTSSEGKSFELDKIKVQTYIKLREKVGSMVPFRLSSHDPFMVMSQGKSNNTVVLSIPIDRDWSNLPAKPLYVPVLHRIIEFLAGADQKMYYGSFKVGKKIHIRLPSASLRVKDVLSSDNKKLSFDQTGKRLAIDPVQKPGHYRIFCREKKMVKNLYFTVNIDRSAEEGNLEKISDANIKKIFPDNTITFLKNGSTVLHDVITALRGKEISRSLIGLLILLLVLELWLASKKRVAKGQRDKAA